MAFHSLSIGTSALITARYGLDITGQNLANIDTPGYSRQTLNQAATKGYAVGTTAILGTGVWTESVKRIGNEYVEKQLRQAVSSDEYYGSLQNCYRNIQSVFNELTGNGLSDSMNSFWASMSDFSTHVETLSVRKTAITDAVGMTQRFNRLSQQLTEARRGVDEEIAGSIGQINRILSSIAQYNREIVNSELGGASGRTANDLRDQRGELVKELYQYMDVDVVEEGNGSFVVSLHGRSLVYFDQAREIGVEKTMSDDGTMVNTPVFASDGFPLSPLDGLLAAQIRERDVVIPGYQREIDVLAANFIWEFNRVHSQTRGLSTFDSLTSTNAPIDPAVTLDKLAHVDNYPEGTFRIVNGNMEFIIHNRNTGQPVTINLEIDLDGRNPTGGEPDMILWDPANPDASHSFVNRLQRELDKAVPGVFRVSVDSEYRVSIESMSEDYGFCFGRDTSGVLAALGLNTFFTGHNAATMGVNDVFRDDPSLLGGAYSFNAGDNDGIIDLLLLRDKELSGTGGMALEDYYLSVAGRLASEANSVTNMKFLSLDIYNRMFVQRESLAGVNEDEEVAKMITYQRSFQSAAKFISTVDQLYETLMNM